MTKRAGIYCRISEDREGRELGVTRQEEDCRALAARHGLTVVDVYRDNDISASTRTRAKRPAYRRLIEDAKAGKVDSIIAYTSSRLTRRLREHEDLIDLATDYGVTYHYVRSPSFNLNDSQGRTVARMCAVQDAGEAEQIAERVTRAKLQAATEGRFRGGRRPYGFESDGVEVRETEAEVIRYMARQILAGTSVRGLAADLNGKGHTTSMGQPWRQDAVRAVLLRARNAGLIEHRGEIIGPAVWEPIISQDMWHGIRAVLLDPARIKNKAPFGRVYPGSGIYLCGLCDDGTTVTSSQTSRKRPAAIPAYTCRTKRHIVRSCREVDAYITAIIVARLSKPDAKAALAPQGRDTTALWVEAKKLRDRLDELAALYDEGVIDGRQLREGSLKTRARLEVVEAEIGQANKGSLLEGLTDEVDVEAWWQRLDLDRQRLIIDTLMTVKLLASGRGRPAGWRAGDSYFRPETVTVEWK